MNILQQANRLTGDGTVQYIALKNKHSVLPPHQILKLYIQVLADGELRVWNGFVKVGVQIVEHLHNEDMMFDMKSDTAAVS